MNSEDDVAESLAGAMDSLGNASLDSIITWLAERRSEQPSRPLAELIKGKSIPAALLVDIACIDLIERRRTGQTAATEQYVNELPELANDLARLDLIDAEICVERELGGAPSLESYADRFPDLRTQIAELLSMSSRGCLDHVPLNAQQGSTAQPSEPSEPSSNLDLSGDFSYTGGLASPLFPIAINNLHRDDDHGMSGLAGATHPVDVPEWFIGDHCVAAGPGHWLVRGRDSLHGETLAMKVIALPVQVTSGQVDQLLDACEQAAKVQNRSWVVPAVAAVQHRHLAVIRPWVYANPWQPVSKTLSPSMRLRDLAAVAYAIQSAHQVGATHGAIQSSNLLIDHERSVRIVDCCAAVACLERWLINPEAIATLSQRVSLDIQDLVRLIATDAVQWPRSWAEKLVSQVRSIADQQGDDSCGRIGDMLLRWADQQSDHSSCSPAGSSWRARFADWILRQDG